MLCVARGLGFRGTLACAARARVAPVRGYAQLSPPSKISPSAQSWRGLAFKPREGRTPRVKVAEKEAPREWWEQEQTQGSVSSQPRTYETERQQQRYEQQQSVGSQFEAVTSGVQAHLQRVYATLAAGIAVAAGTSIFAIGSGLASVVHPFIPAILGLAPLIYLTGYTNKYVRAAQPAAWLPLTVRAASRAQSHSAGFRAGLFAMFTALSGMAIAPLIKMFLGVSAGVIPVALGATAAIFATMTALAMMAPRGAMLSWGVPLGGGMLVLFGLGLMGMFVPVTSPWAPIFHNIMLYGGLGLFTIYVAYDTQQIVSDYEHGDDDHLRHAAMLFINFQAIFSRLLIILGGRSDD